MERLTIQVGGYEVNCSLLIEDGRAFITDPGSEGERITGLLEKKGLEPAAILLTHAHFDHISGIPALQKAYPGLPVYVHPGDVVMFGHPFNQAGGEYALIEKPSDIRDAATLPEVLEGVEVIHTPGHTPGGVCYHFPKESLLLSGDTLFAGSIGRTDFPGGSMTRMMESLAALSKLPEETLVIPGHGPHTTIAAELKSNPYLG